MSYLAVVGAARTAQAHPVATYVVAAHDFSWWCRHHPLVLSGAAVAPRRRAVTHDLQRHVGDHRHERPARRGHQRRRHGGSGPRDQPQSEGEPR